MASFCRSRDRSRSAWCSVTRAEGRIATTVAASSRPAATLSQCSPGRGTITVRSRSSPYAAAAASPKSGTPTTADHSPAWDGPAIKAMARLKLSTAYAPPVFNWSTPASPGSESKVRVTAAPCIRSTRWRSS